MVVGGAYVLFWRCGSGVWSVMTTDFFLMALNLWASAAPQGQCPMHTKTLLRVHWLNQKQDF